MSDTAQALQCHIARSMLDLVQRSHPAGLHAYALLDGAQAEGAHDQLAECYVLHESLFDDTHEANLPEIAPRLIELDSDEASPARELLAQLGAHYPCLSWFASPVPIDTLAKHLRRFHRTSLSDNQKMLMRWYDTRTLPTWVQCLNSDQRALFFAGSCQWWHTDRFGRVQQLASPNQAVAIPGSVPVALFKEVIELSDEQLDALMQAAEPQLIIHRLVETAPGVVRAISRQQLFDFVAAANTQLKVLGITEINSQVPAIMLGLYTSGRAYTCPEFQALLGQAPVAAQVFSEQVAGLPHSVWQAGPPLWGTPTRPAAPPADNWVDWLEPGDLFAVAAPTEDPGAAPAEGAA